ncbi:hypothetical protein BX666DRAFT_2020220 [Dichotomocladium elegans]|nr:hypothetical protein BX666DRAFT_2020220 [Dichotomocladium elegans]
MKQRFNALDIRATVINFRERLIGLRLQNIYDVDSKTFLLKFAKPDDKELLRKYFRTRRLTNVRQVGVDRIVDFEFAAGDKSFEYHIIAEFYAQGNIILTDESYKILAILRVVNSDDVKMAVGETYKIENALPDFQKLDAEKLQAALRKAGPKDTLKKVLNMASEYGPAMVEHVILQAKLNPNLKVASEFDSSDDSPSLKALIEAFKEADSMVESTKSNVPKGYIILLEKEKRGDAQQEEIEIYDEYHPYLYKQHEARKHKEFSTFDAAVDEFYSAIEAQKIELKAMQQRFTLGSQEQTAMKKLEAVRKEQESRIQGLLSQQVTNVRKAQLIEFNLDMVDAAITIIRNAIASQMDWVDLKELVLQEKNRGNPIAQMIDDLKLATSQITLLLSAPEDSDEGSDEESDESDDNRESAPQQIKVDIDIGLTAYANARKYYDQKRSTAQKHEKTIAASSKALKSAERKIKKDLKETKITTTINKIRKPFWFEKFLWFISTENFLVIAGRDMQQNEMLVKRYLRKGDAYIHADLHGAATVIVKNKPENEGNPIPPSTLFQAGIMSVCQSKAWDAKIVTSAYWVHADQVSKSAPTGEYLTTGSFMIRGKKNFLPPVQLVYGFGYLFKLDESSIGNHVKRNAEENEQDNDNIAAVATKEDKDDGDDQADSPKDDANDDFSDSSSSSSSEDEFPDTQLAPTPSRHEMDGQQAQNQSSLEEKRDDAEWSKYNLEEHGVNDDADVLPAFAQSANVGQKQARCAKERRRQKKAKKAEDGGETTGKGKVSVGKSNETERVSQTAAPKVRGQRGKSKKIKEKYADQDEEERRLRMELLGSNKGPQPKGKKAKKEAQLKAEKLARAKEQEERKAAKEKTQQKDDAEQPPAQIEEGEDKEQIRQMLKEENIIMLEAEEAANLSVVDSLTPNPTADDIIHFAVPVCAPYTALQKYKYKVKLTPGSLKRGKAYKQAQSVFLNLAEATAREKELMKSVPEMEAINTMMGKVKVSAPNLEASKRKKSKA